jgi:hypothetical protein
MLSGASRLQNVEALFFMLEWTTCSLHKKCVETHYDELVFLPLEGSVGHLVHSGASSS